VSDPGSLANGTGAASDDVTVRLTGVGEAARVNARGSAKIGEIVRVLVRHSAIRICSSTSADAQFRAKVLDCAFRGRGYEHALLLTDGSTLHGVFAEERSERAENVGVHLDAKGCCVFLESQFDETEGPIGSVSQLVTPNDMNLATRTPMEMRA
jgi:hypothetical protein